MLYLYFFVGCRYNFLLLLRKNCKGLDLMRIDFSEIW